MSDDAEHAEGESVAVRHLGQVPPDDPLLNGSWFVPEHGPARPPAELPSGCLELDLDEVNPAHTEICAG